MSSFSELGLTPHTTLYAISIGYLLGSVASGLLFTRLAGLGDVREIGSGNIGATNVLRTGNKKLAALTLITDLLKGTVAVLIAARWGEAAALLAGLSAFLGHLFPIWLRFKGGKGVATYIGVLLGLFWPVCLVFCATWLIVALLTRYSSLSALTASILAPASLVFFDKALYMPVIALMTLLLILRHHANISRLLNGTETKIGATS